MDQPLNEQDEIDYEIFLEEEEREYERMVPKYSEARWLLIFPEEKKRFGKIIIARLKLFIDKLELALAKAKEETIQELKNNPPEADWRDEMIKERGRNNVARITKKINDAKGQIQLVRSIGRKTDKIIITDEMVENARKYPIEKLIQINRAGFARCFSHNDHKPSAYCKNNFMYCFVCGKSWDTIQLLVERDGLKFKDAVMQLQ